MDVIDLKYVKLQDQFWSEEADLIRTKVLPYQWEALNDRVEGAEPSYSVRNFLMAADPNAEPEAFQGRVFQDSDLYKWLEAAAYVLAQCPDETLEKQAEEAIDVICKAQAEDGYLNTYYIVTGRDKEFTNIRENHELYCFGHLAEAAAAYYEATGRDRLLNAAIRYADYIAGKIGPEEGKKHAYPGHEIAEMALVRLYELTGEERFLQQAVYYVDERGKQPYYYDSENNPYKGIHQIRPYQYSYYQAHKPVREQDEALGHAVRAVYLYSGMASVAKVTQDEKLKAACEKLWESIVRTKMYVTGGIGSTHVGEAFTHPFDLPNDTCYTESCASIGLVFFARRMLELSEDARYADVMERALYNGILSGIALDGTTFFYVNPLEADPEDSVFDPGKYHVKTRRQPWFGCACCPPNIARMYASLGNYIYTESDSTVFVNLLIGSSFEKDGLSLTMRTAESPGLMRISFIMKGGNGKTLAVRRPYWADEMYIYEGCEAEELQEAEEDQTYGVLRNIEEKAVLENGYYHIPVTSDEAAFTAEILFSPHYVQADPRVKADIGKAALVYGPWVYCLEEADNGHGLSLLSADPDSPFMFRKTQIAGRPCLEIIARGSRRTPAAQDELYGQYHPAEKETVSLRFIPYYMWANREEGQMQVFVRVEE